MPRFSSQLQKLLALLLIVLSVNSCDPGCVEAYEFDSETRFVNAKPEDEGIYGSYNDTTGGEIAAWTNTNLRTNGEPLIISVSGGWTAWDEASNNSELEALESCNMCFKKKDSAGNEIPNCICETGKIPEPEKDTFGDPLNVDCSDPVAQNNPNLCTCTQQHGTAENPGEVYSIALNYQNKDETPKLPDEQFGCRYSKGLGLYVGLFGKDGYTTPTRIYHVYPTEEVCDIPRNANGECKGEEGIDRTRYVYMSPNSAIFVKDDLAGNDGSDVNMSDDIYHRAGEYIKFIINDRYYHDNYGGYNIEFLGGFNRGEGDKLLEYIVSMIEDALLGKIDADGNRDGGAVKFMYNSIVKDSVFILIVQLTLVLYITVYGIFVISGSIDVTRKGLMQRTLYIAIVALFTTETSWKFYDQFVVGLFKDSMDFLIVIFMNASDTLIDPSSIVITSQIDRAADASHSTRFSYADAIIKKLFSAATSKKILGLFFSDLFGWLYVIVTYCLIFGFLGVMVFAALMYVKILLTIVLLLCLGPLFIVMILFSKTKDIFKRWLAILAGQSMQIIGLFLVFYLFVVLIDRGFNELLYYKTCTEVIDFKLFQIPFYKAEIYRPLGVWFLMFIEIGAMIFLLYMIIQQIPPFIGRLVVVDGQKADVSGSFISDTRNFVTKLGKDLFGRMRSFGDKVWDNKGFSATGAMGSAGRFVVGGTASLVPGAIRKMGFGETADTINKYSPFGLYSDYQLNKLIRQKQSGGGDKAAIRAAVLAEARKRGFDDDATIKRLNQKLSIDPINKAIQDEFKNLRKEGFKDIFDDEKVRDELKRRLEANKELDDKRIAEALDARKKFVVGYEDAARMAARDSDLAKQYRDLDADQKLKYEKFWRAAGYGKERMNKLFDAELHQNKEDADKDSMSIRDRLASAYNRSNVAGVLHSGYYKAVHNLEQTISKAESSTKDHDDYMAEAQKWQEAQKEKLEFEEYQRVLEDEKKRLAKIEEAKNNLEAELNKNDKNVDPREKAKAIEEMNAEYENKKLASELWRQKSEDESTLKALESDPENNRSKIDELKGKIAGLTNRIEFLQGELKNK